MRKIAAPRDFDEIASQGYLDSPPPNPSSVAPEALQGYHPRPGPFWPGLVVRLSSSATFQAVRSVLPYYPSVRSVIPSTDLPMDASSATAFDNRFLLGLRSFAWGQNERFDSASASERGSGPPQALPGSKLALRPKIWTWGSLVTAWRPQAPSYRTFGEA